MVEKQYIDLFKQFRSTIDEHSCEVMNACRLEAAEALEQSGLPVKGHEDYLRTNVAKFFEAEYGLNLQQLGKGFDPYAAHICNVPELSSALFFMVNDLFYGRNLPENHLPKGVFVGSIREFAQTYPDVARKHYGRIADVKNNGIVAFNTMFAQDGLMVYVPQNVVVEQPIQLINLLQNKVDSLVNRRLLIVAEASSQVKVLVCDHAASGAKFLVTQVTEIYAGENAMVDFYELEETGENVIRLANTFVQQEASSNVLSNNVTLQCGTTRNNYRVKLAGENAEATVCGIVVADKEQHVDTHAFLDHAVPHCQSTQLFKYVLQDHAVGAFCGRILVEQDAQKTMAYQTNRNLITSPTARMYSKPQLEIYADDVKCSHGLTTGQLDENALFYMRARGISEPQARQMLMQAFAVDVLEHIRLDSLKERLINLIDRRFQGEQVRCGGGCSSCR